MSGRAFLTELASMLFVAIVVGVGARLASAQYVGNLSNAAGRAQPSIRMNGRG